MSIDLSWPHRSWEVPYATLVFSAVEIAVFYAGASYALAAPMPLGEASVWRLFTCTFAHGSLQHLLSNVAAQLFLMPLFEWDAGTVAAVIVYLLAALCGSIAQSVSYSGPPTILLGASGAVFGILGGHLSTIVMNWSEISNAPIFFGGVLLYITNEVITAVTTTGTTARVAHLVGALAGTSVGLVVTVNIIKKPYELYCTYLGYLSVLVCLVVLIILYGL